MRWYEDKKKLPRQYDIWHAHFLIWPAKVELADGRNATVWMERVERKGTYGYGGWSWRYRELLTHNA